MAWAAVAAAGVGLVGGMMMSDSQRSAGNSAADAQSAASAAGIEEQRRQFDAVRQLLAPYMQAGTGALGQQQALLGLNGSGPQQSAINGIQQSPAFTSALKLGENRILANASATGGLRGGNVQAALAQFSPNLLSAAISDQYSRLGGLTSLGQNAAAGVGNAGMQTGSSISSLLGQIGSAQAGGALSNGLSQMLLANGLARGAGTLIGSNMGGGLSSPNAGYVDLKYGDVPDYGASLGQF